jgi:hypothetical protein
MLYLPSLKRINEMKRLRQGQTVYMIDNGFMYNPPRPSIVTMFLHSQKTPLPEEGFIIEKWNVRHVNNMIHKYGWKGIFTSRRKAQAALKAI